MIPCRRAIRLRDAERVRVIRAEQDGEHDAHGGDHERGEQRPAEAVDGQHPVGQRRSASEDAGVRDQHEQEAEHERERQAQRGEHGRDDRVQRRDDRRDDQRAPEALDADTGQQRRRPPSRRRPWQATRRRAGTAGNADARAASPWIGRTSARSRWASGSPCQSGAPRRDRMTASHRTASPTLDETCRCDQRPAWRLAPALLGLLPQRLPA